MRLPYERQKVSEMRYFAAIGLSLAAAASGVLPAQALPAFQVSNVSNSDIVQVRDRGWYRGRHGGGHWAGRPRGGGYWAGNRYRHGYYRNGYRYGPAWGGPYRYGGYYGRYYGPYYGGYDDFGAVVGGLAAGAIIGSVIAQPRYVAPRYYGGNRHVSWCYARYRSYRAYDNTFQPYYGPRRQCIAPY